MLPTFQYIYGPVESWRLGRSVGIDPLSASFKICNMDCVYCQLGKTTHWSNEPKVYVSTSEIVRELKLFLEALEQKGMREFDHLTFSGRGEPTLAKNLGEMISEVKKICQEKVAVITNATLLHLAEVRQELALCDCVVVKLDAWDQESFQRVDQVMNGIRFQDIIEGIKLFRNEFCGRLILQVMFVEENENHAAEIAKIIKGLAADEVEIDTPLRPCLSRPLDTNVINKIKLSFSGLPVVTVYDQRHHPTAPFSDKDTIKRHGVYRNHFYNN